MGICIVPFLNNLLAFTEITYPSKKSYKVYGSNFSFRSPGKNPKFSPDSTTWSS